MRCLAAHDETSVFKHVGGGSDPIPNSMPPLNIGCLDFRDNLSE